MKAEIARRPASLTQVPIEMDDTTAVAVQSLRQRDRITMSEYQKRAAQAYALMFPGWPYPRHPKRQPIE
jgi:hypothetical protein